MTIRLMTVKQLEKACQENKYILLRYYDGYLTGVNCKVAKLARKRKPLLKDTDKTDYIGFIPCNLDQYI
jgi:hypothetical protein